MEQTGKSSRKLWFVVVGLVVLALIVIGAVYMMVGNGTKKDTATTTATTSTAPVNLKAKISDDMSTLDANIKQANKDQAAAKAILDNNKGQIKVGQ